MATVTGATKKEHDEKEMAKRSGKHEEVNEQENLSTGDLADKAWAMSFKNFPSTEAANAHREAAKSYRKDKQHEYADRHEDAAFSHIKAMMKSK